MSANSDTALINSIVSPVIMRFFRLCTVSSTIWCKFGVFVYFQRFFTNEVHPVLEVKTVLLNRALHLPECGHQPSEDEAFLRLLLRE